jgi:ribose 5-phosphate isomerase A
MMQPMSQHQAKRRAAAAALELLPEHGVIGLGSGATADLFIEALAELVRAGRRFIGVPTSEASRRKASACGIELLSDDGPWAVDVCVDGADEVSPELDLIKGGGGCHTREKIVNHAAAVNVIVVEETKLVRRLGERWAVPVEIVPFGYRSTLRLLERWGSARIRMRDGAFFLTDSGNFICDVRVAPIADPAGLDRELASLPGVVETGLFCGRADVVVVGSDQSVRHLRRTRPDGV